jgi:hypothetical protein
LLPLKKNVLLPISINRGGFHGLREKKLRCEVGKKIISSPVFFSSPLPTFLCPSLAPPPTTPPPTTVHNLPYNNRNVDDHFVVQLSLLPCLFILLFHSSYGAAPKWPTQPTFNYQNLTIYNSHFEPMMGILQGLIKDQDLAPLKTKCPSFTLYK